ncbi:MAG: NADP-dependent malic enzyme [Desulfobacteraceae bacterium]|nr:MAG: NADP-dependent malic enzyme [Desulfobacteraceae bacterium]
MDQSQQRTLQYRRKYQGVIGIDTKVPIKDEHALSLAYTPGVADVCMEIFNRPASSFSYSCRGNTVALVSDGSAVRGSGFLGPEAVLPVLENKSVLFKTFAGVDAFPIALSTHDPLAIIENVCLITPTFGAVCLEDIASPGCFCIEEHLKQALNIPVLHNDQHVAGIEALGALINASKLVGKKLEDLSVVICGAGAAGIGTAKLLMNAGIKDLVVCDRAGAIYKYRTERMNWAKAEIAKTTNPRQKKGTLEDVLVGADAFIGFAAGGVLTADMISSMASDPIIFALSVPEPEIIPAEAKKGGARIIATSRSDYPNLLDIALIFPGLFRGILDVAARRVTLEMEVAAATAFSQLVPNDRLSAEYFVPEVFDFRVAPAIAAAVARAAIDTGTARVQADPDKIYERLERLSFEGKLPSLPSELPSNATLKEQALDLHRRYQGLLEIKVKIPARDRNILNLFYLPPHSVQTSREIQTNRDRIYDYTAKSNLVAIVTDGSAVLGLGNIGPRAALPVMEGKAVLFHTFGGVEAFPICIAAYDPEQIVETVKRIATVFGGINLEDISAPRCFFIEERLRNELNIPVFHDDQHGTAVVVAAGLLNALKVTGKDIEIVNVVINGAGAAGVAVANFLLSLGIKHIVVCDSKGIIYQGRKGGMNPAKEAIAKVTNLLKTEGNLSDALAGADVLIGVSKGNLVSEAMVRSMASNPIIFALANPIPEIMPEEAKKGGASVVATGRSDYPNQVNNILAFPGIFRGALDVRAKSINEAMKIAATYALARAISEKELSTDHILPRGMSFSVPPLVAAAVAKAAIETGEARKKVDPDKVARHTREFIYEGELTLIGQ